MKSSYQENLLDEKIIIQAGIKKIGPDEIFVKFPGWDKYYISQYGQAISLKGRTPRVLSKNRLADGYWRYFFRDNDKFADILVQRAVAQVFLGELFKEDYVIHHLDGNKSNNYYKNLVPLPRGLHKKIHTIQGFSLVMNGNNESFSNPIDISKITGISLSDIILAQEKLLPMKSIIDSNYIFYDVSGWLIGYQFKTDKKAA